ncbi:M48 family metallopeptidase [Treponema zioleckii]|uniref:M48 family metallopeptidase n=1 Tax=Treponema zioleckii TaxID=331680 RepID=UPI00168A7D65|nr:M48 family metallopeptidase [Treponema zioleckii]
MNLSNIFISLFVIGTIFNFCLNMILEFADFRFRKTNGRNVPNELKEFIDAPTLEKTCRYEDSKYKVWIFSFTLTTALEFFIIFSGFLPAVYGFACAKTQSAFLQILIYGALTSLPAIILKLPFSLYREFGIEKRFGFSKMTLKMWILDSVKSFALSMALVLPLLAIALALFKHAENWWWILLGSVYVAFSLGLSVIYPIFIAPLFNKFTPLQEGELKTRLENLLQKCGFKANGLFVMDASKRSGHSNAYFTGFGKSKRVVLYDTLINQLTAEEIEAVLGHELGHYKKHHIVKRLATMIPLIFVMLFVINLFTKMPALYENFGFTLNGAPTYKIIVIGFSLFMSSFGGFSILFDLISNFASRKHEFEADRFSAEICGSGKGLVTALIKLNKENLSEIECPKIYSAFFHSHPQLLERIRALEK